MGATAAPHRRRAIAATASECGMGGARDDAAGARAGARREEGRRRAHGASASARSATTWPSTAWTDAGLTRAVTDYARRNPSFSNPHRWRTHPSRHPSAVFADAGGTQLALIADRCRASPAPPSRCDVASQLLPWRGWRSSLKRRRTSARGRTPPRLPRHPPAAPDPSGAAPDRQSEDASKSSPGALRSNRDHRSRGRGTDFVFWSARPTVFTASGSRSSRSTTDAARRHRDHRFRRVGGRDIPRRLLGGLWRRSRRHARLARRHSCPTEGSASMRNHDAASSVTVPRVSPRSAATRSCRDVTGPTPNLTPTFSSIQREIFDSTGFERAARPAFSVTPLGGAAAGTGLLLPPTVVLRQSGRTGRSRLQPGRHPGHSWRSRQQLSRAQARGRPGYHRPAHAANLRSLPDRRPDRGHPPLDRARRGQQLTLSTRSRPRRGVTRDHCRRFADPDARPVLAAVPAASTQDPPEPAEPPAATAGAGAAQHGAGGRPRSRRQPRRSPISRSSSLPTTLRLARHKSVVPA